MAYQAENIKGERMKNNKTNKVSMKSLLLLCAFMFALPSYAGINNNNLGASYSSNQQQLDFRLYSSKASKIKLYLYSQALGASEISSYELTKNAQNIWSLSLQTSQLDSRLSGT
ncbi:MAG: hypothetical protein JKY88_03075, partial [Pseudomonadales bacterium]|nr:hypothetical protein [Pseudomonadales bacterium]